MKTNIAVTIVGLAGAIAVVAAFILGDMPNMAVALSLAVAAAIVERAGLSIAPGARASASYVVILAAAALEGPAAAGIVAVGAALGASAFRSRPPSKIVFNAGQLAIAATVAGYLFTLTAVDGNILAVAMAALLAGAVNHAISTCLVSAVVAADAGIETAKKLAFHLSRIAPAYSGVAIPYIVVAHMVSNGLVAFIALALMVAVGTVVARKFVQAMHIVAEQVTEQPTSGSQVA